MNTNHVERAHSIHSTGRSCSTSVYQAFADVNRAGGTASAPRSIEGKCGALLAARQVLADMGVDAQDDLERRFRERFGHVRCDELLRTRFACGEFVVEAARLVDEYLGATT
ncbi:MAG: C-GCAxxG-C-C family protein [Coriobacteriales bacterium]|nr:C-GCAxxG-C-C family protein [Coriobacteriales bacterium]